MDQVLVNLEGEASAVVCRFQDQKGTWLCLKETQQKLFPFLPRQTFLHQLSRQRQSKPIKPVTSRESTDEEKAFMRLTGAIKKKAKSVKLLHIEQAVEAARKLSLRVSLQSGIASIGSCTAYDASSQDQASKQQASPSAELLQGKHHKH